jgi:predicted deacetylase
MICDAFSIPQPARYLLRFDDLCPTVSRERWQLCRGLVDEFRVRPILAVVPDNLDPDLAVSPADAGFWREVRAMEKAGATIGLHGYHHLRQSRGRSFVPLQRASEFAGVPGHWQRTWIWEGLDILRQHGLNPRIWVAPQHGFDGDTLRALKAERIHLLSDGFARVPFVRGGMTWIPQQLWAPLEKSEGLWTICIHPNTARPAEIETLRAFLRGHAHQFTSVDAVMTEFAPGGLTLGEQVYAHLAIRRILAARVKKRFVGHRPRRSGGQAQ